MRVLCTQAQEADAQENWFFTLKKAHQVESVLAAVRMAGGITYNAAVSQVDLEEVFVRMMQADSGLNGLGGTHDWLMDVVFKRSAPFLECWLSTVAAPVITALLYLMISF